MTRKLVIVGAGHAAGQLVASLKQHGYSGSIVLLGEEAWLPYQRPPLSKKFLSGEIAAERLFVKPADFYADEQLDVRLETRVERLDLDAKVLETERGDRIEFDTLVLSLGSSPRRIDVPGSDLPGVSYLRNISDVEAIRASLADRTHLAIVGAGYIGLEVAAVVRKMGIGVTVIEAQERVMSRVVSSQVSAFYERAHRDHGVEFLLSTGVTGFSGSDRVTAVQLDSGQQIDADAVVVGVGVVPNTALAEAAGLGVDDGIVVDSRCVSSHPDVLAIGDCTRHPNPLLGRNVRLESVHNALEQARTAAANLCGIATDYAQIPWFWSDQYDLKLQIVGLSEGYDEVVMRGDPATRSFSCLYLREGRLIALDAINRPRDFMQSKPLIAEGTKVDPEHLGNAELPLKDMT